MEEDWVTKHRRFDRESLQDTAGGDQTDVSFIEVYRRYAGDIYRFHLSRVGHIHDAQDLTAETFYAAFDNYGGYRSELGTIKTWLFGIARHKQIDFLRKRRRRRAFESTKSPEDLVSANEMNNSDELEIEMILKAMSGLSTTRTEALALHFFAGLSLRETAEVMGKNYESVKKLVQRGLRDLRRKLNDLR